MIDLKNIRKYNFERDATGIKYCDGDHSSHEACNYTDMDHEEVLELLLALRHEYLKTDKMNKLSHRKPDHKTLVVVTTLDNRIIPCWYENDKFYKIGINKERVDKYCIIESIVEWAYEIEGGQI